MIPSLYELCKSSFAGTFDVGVRFVGQAIPDLFDSACNS